MAIEERRRVALHRAAADTWGQEVADTLVELVAPSGHELATREDVRAILDAMDAMERRWDERYAAQDERWDARFAAQDEKWDARLAAQEEKLDLKFAAQDERWDARLAAQDQRWDARLAAHDAKWDRRHAEVLAQFEPFEERSQARFHESVALFERRIADAVTHQTRTLVFSQLAAIVVIAGLAFGLR